MTHFADRVCQAIRHKHTPLCVGLDPRWDSLPVALRQKYGGDSLESVAAAFEEFCLRVLDLVAPTVAVVKPQSAFFEMCGPPGMTALQRVLKRARELGLLSILDGKRNDIATTAAAYADAALGGVRLGSQVHPVWHADSLTVNPYLGRDAVEPFLQSARKVGGGVFVLVRTSNSGARLFQDLPVATIQEGMELRDPSGQLLGKLGPTSSVEPLFVHVGRAVAAWARENRGHSGFGDVGAVVGATYPAELALLRKEMPEVLFLVPGFGAQGGTAADIAAAFRPDGMGAIVNSSRGITFPFQPDDPKWEERILDATRETVAALATVCRVRD